MAPVFSIPENVQKLWDAWSIRGFIIISFSVQAFLLLFAPLRQRIRGWGKWFIWGPYLFADWVAIYTIGLIVHSNSSKKGGPPSDIMAFWAPFLLLHLGGPDNITSYSLEDNKLWQRRWLKLVLQFCFTIYAIFKSFSRYELFFSTLFVLVAGMVKYVERNVALYRASLDNFGENWKVPSATDGLPIPVQFKDVKNNGGILQTAVLLLGSLKRIISTGPAPNKEELKKITSLFYPGQRCSCDALQIIEIELSLLYELLHTKLPVITTAIGFIFRIASFSCILGALLSFSLVKKHYQLGLVEILLTYGLLIGTLALDFLSIILLIKCSDWFAVVRPQDQHELPEAFINRHRWSKEVSQLNFLTYHVKDYPVWLKKLDERFMWSLLESIKIYVRCPPSKNFGDPLWHFIWSELFKKYEWHEKNKPKDWLSRPELKDHAKEKGNLIGEFIFEVRNFSKTLLVWHIGTELCFQDDNDQYRHESEGTDYRSICKLLSDYMFYLAVGVQPSMMVDLLEDWKNEFREICKETRQLVPWSFFSNEKTACKMISFGLKEEKGNPLSNAVDLACRLKNKKQWGYDYSWELMSKVWVHLMFFAAVTCSSYVHVQQPSQGGELLTFVWLSLNHLGLGMKYKTLKELLGSPPMDKKKEEPKEKKEEDGQKKRKEKEFMGQDYYGSFKITLPI